jgi:quercetin dioxygenase-like cupin family protein
MSRFACKVLASLKFKIVQVASRDQYLSKVYRKPCDTARVIERVEGGRVRRTVERAGMNAFEAVYEPQARLPDHEHPTAFFTYVLRGQYTERVSCDIRECRRGSVIFHSRSARASLRFDAICGRRDPTVFGKAGGEMTWRSKAILECDLRD